MKSQKVSTLVISSSQFAEEPLYDIFTESLEMVRITGSTKEGIRYYKKNRPELVLLDQDISIDDIVSFKEIDKNARILLIINRSNSKKILEAFEHGIKGILVRPLVQKKLKTLLNRVICEISIERKSVELDRKRRYAESARKKSEEILLSVSFAAEQFLKHNYNNQSVRSVLASLGNATKVSRVYIFHNNEEDTENLKASQQFEWTAPGIKPEIDNPDLQNFSYSDNQFDRWKDILTAGKAIYGNVKDFPVPEKELLSGQDIKSIVGVPIRVNEKWWGFMGLDDCVKEREWTKSEINALTAAAEILGAALHRQEVERRLLKFSSELEITIDSRTKDLQNQIKEKAQIEVMLRESEEKYRQIFENANDGILLTMDGIVKFINPKLHEMTGYLPKDTIGKPFIDFLHPDYKELVLENHYRRLRGEEVQERYDIKFIDSKGKNRWFEIKSTMIQWEGGPAVLSFLTDITTRKKTALELQELNRTLEKRVKEELKKIQTQQQLLIQKSKLESLGELAAGMAHEINQPLGSISMGIENVLMRYSNETLTEAYLSRKTESLFQDISRIRQIIDHIRTFSRDQQQGEKLERISVNDVIHNALSLITTQYKHHKINISLELSQNDCFTWGNKYKLEQVILNILSNAKYAIDEKATSSSNIHYQKRITIKSLQKDNFINIDIVDNGTGIPKEIIDNIFDPFFTTKKEESGTGLGLSIIYGIIKDMKGDIKVDSKENEYTKITIIVPAHLEKEEIA
jgi:PAS domain S-box-containing protein